MKIILSCERIGEAKRQGKCDGASVGLFGGGNKKVGIVCNCKKCKSGARFLAFERTPLANYR